MHRWAGQFFHTAQDKKLCGCIELIVESRRVRAVWPGNVNDYSLSCACKQNSVAVYPILVFLRVFVCLPHLSVETTTAPLRSAPQEILASADAYPVEFQSLNLELSGRHLKFGRGSHIDRKSTRLNSSHPSISYAVFCLKKKKKTATN